MNVAAMLWVGLAPWIGPQGERATTRFEFHQTHMGSDFKIVLYTGEERVARRASDAAYARIAALDKALSDYNPESELMRLCDRAGGPPVEVSDDLFRCLAKAQAISEKSDGAFDATIGPVGRLWRRSRRNHALPDAESLAKARHLVGYKLVTLDPKARTVRLAKAGMKLDLGGIAKGFANDEAMIALKKSGITSALVAGSGDILVSDPPPGEEGWRIGIADPEGGPDAPSHFLRLSNRAVSTAGDAEQYAEIGGVRYAHIVDPRTGLGVVSRSSVTVVAAESATADGLDTAAFVLGPEKGIPLIDQAGAAGQFVRADRLPRLVTSPRWWNLVIEAP